MRLSSVDLVVKPSTQENSPDPKTYGAPENSGTQRDRIYKLLMSRQGQWVSSFELAKTGILQYSARVYELRHHNGVTIENETVTVGNQKHGYFRVPIPGETSRPPLPESGTAVKKASRSSRRTYKTHENTPPGEQGTTRGIDTRLNRPAQTVTPSRSSFYSFDDLKRQMEERYGGVSKPVSIQQNELFPAEKSGELFGSEYRDPEMAGRRSL